MTPMVMTDEIVVSKVSIIVKVKLYIFYFNVRWIMRKENKFLDFLLFGL